MSLWLDGVDGHVPEAVDVKVSRLLDWRSEHGVCGGPTRDRLRIALVSLSVALTGWAAVRVLTVRRRTKGAEKPEDPRAESMLVASRRA